MSAAVEFKDFGKISRFRTIEVLITEKIDGTNAQIFVPEDPSEPVLLGSRNKWISVEKDNAGFARWANEVGLDLFRRLGPGRHFGEWYGGSIQRGYGVEKRLALFNVDRFSGGLPEGLPGNVHLVPVLYRGPIDTNVINETIEKLYTGGSVAVPGWTKPEGVIVQVAGLRWKVTDNGDVHKGQITTHKEAVMTAAAERRTKRDQSASARDIALRTITVTPSTTALGMYEVAGKDNSGTSYASYCLNDQIAATRFELADKIVAANAAVRDALNGPGGYEDMIP